MQKQVIGGFCLAALVWLGALAHALEPVNPDLIPEARRVLDYLTSIYGKKTLAGTSGGYNAKAIFEMSGRYPAVLATDASGWNKPIWGDSYRRVLQRYVDWCKKWWHDKGGIVTMQYHWNKPGHPKGSAWAGGRKGTGRIDLKKATTPGTEEHKTVMNDLRRTADYLQQLMDARVPVLWRPLHEIDGGWFWWADGKQPENTAALWRMMFHYFVKERRLHNLIWVYSAGLKVAGMRKDDPLPKQTEHRKRFYPGADYVDIAGIDIYANSWYGWGPYQEDTYPKALQIMSQVCPGKMLALCECGAMPNPGIMAKDGPRWLYCLAWFVGGRWNSVDWVRKCHNHDFVITLDELPALVPHNVAPHARIASPPDGQKIGGDAVEIRAEATDRDGRIAKVHFYQIPAAWPNWFLLRDEARAQLLQKAVPIGEATSPPYACTWKHVRPGWYSLLAKAIDDDGATARSNAVRIAVGMDNLARGKAVRCSSNEQGASATVDGNFFTAWSSEKSDPQWISVDLGSVRTVGGVILLWTKAHARSYTIQLSTDGAQWADAYSVDRERGGSNVITFTPRKARFVRMYGTRRGTTWGGYSLFEFEVYEWIPGHADPARLDESGPDARRRRARSRSKGRSADTGPLARLRSSNIPPSRRTFAAVFLATPA